MVRINIRDKNFDGEPSSCHRGKNKHVEWVFNNELVSRSCFITDMCLADVSKASGVKRKIAWILEPKAIHPHVYEWIAVNNKKFDYVLTFDTELIQRGENFLYYPHGRCWINNYIEVPKSRSISIIASSKRTTIGHQLRHQVISRMGCDMDVYGYGYNPVKDKEEALSPYRFSVTIENSVQPGYWTEKIVDCFATKTIPIFWGDRSVCDHFDSEGILFFNNEQELIQIIKSVRESGNAIYESKLTAVNRNLSKAEEYRIPEDWIFKNYPFLFA